VLAGVDRPRTKYNTAKARRPIWVLVANLAAI
jgi:hypothetical protein